MMHYETDERINFWGEGYGGIACWKQAKTALWMEPGRIKYSAFHRHIEASICSS